VALLCLEGAAWLAANIIEVAVLSATCGVIAVAVVAALIRRQDRRQARVGSLLITRADAAPLPPPRVREIAPAPVVNVTIDAGLLAALVQAGRMQVQPVPVVRGEVER
jgi:hypothetical protein